MCFAEEETRREAEKNIQQNKEKMESQKKLLDFVKLQTATDVPQQDDFNQEEVLGEQQFVDQERNFIVQVEADCSQIKEEREDVCIIQEGEHFGLKQEPQTFEDAMQLHDCKEEEVLTVQQFCNQERISSLNQEKQDAAQVKKEEEELCTRWPRHRTFVVDGRMESDVGQAGCGKGNMMFVINLNIRVIGWGRWKRGGEEDLTEDNNNM
ncbi:uncharacterized protein KZ484_011002 [Pholidichthys leucotaenia]